MGTHPGYIFARLGGGTPEPVISQPVMGMARLLPQPKKHVHCPPWTSPVIFWGHRSAMTCCNGSPSSEDLGLRLGTNRGQVGEVQPGLASTGHNLLPPHRVIPEYFQRSPVLGPHGTGGSPGEDIFHLSVSLTWGAPNRSPNLTTPNSNPKFLPMLRNTTEFCAHHGNKFWLCSQSWTAQQWSVSSLLFIVYINSITQKLYSRLLRERFSKFKFSSEC